MHIAGYHIEFNREYFIEPRWLQSVDEYPDSTREGVAYETCFKLLLDDKNKRNIDKLSENLEEAYDENLLLFLNKLDNMVYSDRCTERLVSLRRQVLSKNWTKIMSASSSMRTERETFWLICRNKFNPGMARSDVLVSSTEVAIALKFIPLPTECDGESKGCSTISSTRLQLDAKSRLPLYAYLPTKVNEFQFIVQGDFLLSSSRETILEDNEWNQCLMNMVPDLIVQVICEMAQWAFLRSRDVATDEEQDASCPCLSQLKCSQFDVDISLQNVLDILPHSGKSTAKLYRDTADKVYSALHDKKFMLSQTNVQSSPSELVYTGTLSFDPRSLISESLLYSATGRRYMHSSCELQKDVIDGLKMKIFDFDTVVACVEYIQDYPDKLSALCGCLIAIDCMCSSADTSVSRRQAPLLVPVQMYRGKRAGQKHSPAVAELKLPQSIVSRLKRCKVWQTVRGTLESLDRTILFMRTDEVESLSTSQKKCINSFNTPHFHVLDDKLFESASAVCAKGDLHVRNLLRKYFKSNETSGGIDEVDADRIIRKIILPVYSSPENDTALDRRTAVAFLAFLALSRRSVDIERSLKEHGVIIPVMSARENQSMGRSNVDDYNGADERKPVKGVSSKAPLSSRYRWTRPHCVRLGVNATEVHLGVEFQDSSTTKLTELKLSTALRQLDWLIVDPLVACYMFEEYMQANSEKVLSDDNLLQSDIASVFKEAFKNQHQKFNDWKRFLSDIVGVVDFFHPGTASNPAPGLFKLLGHLTRNKEPIVTLPNQYTESYVASEVRNKHRYIPMFLPCPNDENCLFHVSADVHQSLEVRMNEHFTIFQISIVPIFLVL